MKANAKPDTINIGGISYSFMLVQKKIRHYYMRIKDEQVYVSVPINYDQETLASFLQKSLPTLLKRTSKVEPLFDFNQGYLDFLGNRYIIHFKEAKQFSYAFDSPYVMIEDKTLTSETIQKILEQNTVTLKERYDAIINKHPEFKQPKLKLRMMTSKWGVYYVQKHEITLNKRLLHMSHDCIDYVIYHECCHYFEPNHSSRFYQRLKNYVPNYVSIQQQMKMRRLK